MFKLVLNRKCPSLTSLLVLLPTINKLLRKTSLLAIKFLLIFKLFFIVGIIPLILRFLVKIVLGLYILRLLVILLNSIDKLLV